MGKGTDKLYITHSEWASEDAFSASAGAGVARARNGGPHAAFKRLPFNFCSLSLQPFAHPVCTPTGTIFDLTNILPWIKKHGTNPVDGSPLKSSDLIKLTIAKNEEGDYVDPVTYKVLTDNTHIVALRNTGNVFSWDTVDRLNIKGKLWRDLVTDEEFSRKDIITLQDPQNIESRNLSSFNYLKEGETEILEENQASGSVNTNALGSSAKILKAKEAVAKARADRVQQQAGSAGSKAVSKSGSGSAASKPGQSQPGKPTPYNAARFTTGKAAASFTSTGLTPHTSAELALLSEEEYMLKRGRVKGKGYARIDTTGGHLNVELYAEYAPKAVWNFIQLAKKGYYKDITFHRNIKGFMIQGGDPTGTGRGGESVWGKYFADEFEGPLKHDGRGTLSMANKGKNTNSSQFFFAYRALPHLDRKHTVFGRLIDDPTPSSATLNRLETNPVESSTNRPTPEIRIKDVTVFVDPFEDFLKQKRAEDTQDPSASTVDERSEASRREDDDRVTWTGKRVRGHGANTDGESTGVGKYLKAALADREEDEIVEFVDEPEPEPARKKAKGTGGFGDFSSCPSPLSSDRPTLRQSAVSPSALTPTKLPPRIAPVRQGYNQAGSGSSSPPKDRIDSTPPVAGIDTSSLSLQPENASPRDKRFSPPGAGFFRRQSEDQSPASDKKRRSSTVTKAASFFSNAKNSLSLNGGRDSSSFSTSPSISESPLEKLGKMDPALSVPQGSFNNSAGESAPTARSSFRVGVTEDKNRKCRRTMEDTHSYLYNFLGTPAPNAPPDINGNEPPGAASEGSEDSKNVVETDNGYFAIFDGHAGTFAAEWCGKKLHLILEEIMRRSPNTPVPELLDQTFTSVDQQLEKLPLKNSGCTAVTAVLRWEDRIPSSSSATGSAALAPAAAAATNSETTETPTQDAPSAGSFPQLQEKAARQRVLYTANVGDARIVLCRNGKALRLSYDHKGSDENEGKRISNAGGLILNNRVNGVLAVTRALGDAYLKDLVTGHPYTTETVIQPDADEFIILACDGLWDVCSDQEAVDLIRNVQDAQNASKILVDHALARFSTDNLSCMVIRLDSNRVKDVVNNKAEPIGVDGDPANAPHGISEADKILEGARKNMANAGIADDPEAAEQANEAILEKMANSDQEAGPEMAVDDPSHLPSVDILSPAESRETR